MNGLKINDVVCFTGHRSQKLPWGFNEKDERCFITSLYAYVEIERAIVSGKKHFISGMALGFDMMCAELVLELKKKYKDIFLECAIPCKGQELRWPSSEQNRYREIVSHADKITIISNVYTNECMHERNKYMIDNASLVIALFNGKSGGTKITIDYAKSQNKDIVIIKPKENRVLSEEDVKVLFEIFHKGKDVVDLIHNYYDNVPIKELDEDVIRKLKDQIK